jgi:hypothetical protein
MVGGGLLRGLGARVGGRRNDDSRTAVAQRQYTVGTLDAYDVLLPRHVSRQACALLHPELLANW